MSDRMSKINQRVKREIGEILHRELQDPRLEFVTITAAEVSRDLQHARVYYSVLGDKAKTEAAQQALDSASGLVRKLIGQRIRLRYTPEIAFVLDRSIEYGMRIDSTIERIKSERQENTQGDTRP